MTLKGLNRSKFEARLAKSIRYRLEDLGKFKGDPGAVHRVH